jgi:hypothetical protein
MATFLPSANDGGNDDGDEGGREKGDGGRPDERGDVPMPEYANRAVAQVVFSSLHFYGGSERARAAFKAASEPLGSTRTVGDLRRECYRQGKPVEEVLYDTYGVPYTSCDYFNAGDVATLERLEYVALNAHHEVCAFQLATRRWRDWYSYRLPAMDELRREGTDQPHCYMSPDCYVLGPSGSGKTFFALEYLKDFQNWGKRFLDDARVLPQVTLYLQPAESSDLTSPPDKTGREYGQLVADWIRRAIENVLQRKIRGALPMHACLIFDNAGDPRLDGAFLDRDVVGTIRTKVEQSIFKQIVVAVVGTGLITASIPEGRDGAYHFRMKPLQREDLDRMVGNRFYDGSLPWYKIEGGIPVRDPKRTARAIAGAIEAQPALMAAARNTQMAFAVVDAVVTTILPPEARYEGRRLAEHWSAHVGANAAALLREALRGYVQSTSVLSRLDPAQQRRVAFWTLWMVNSEKKWVESSARPGRFRYPEFPGLNVREKEAAMAMVEINTVKYRGWGAVVRFEKYVATIVPANVLVLFYLLGVPTSVLTGWATNDAGAALYAVLQWVVEKVQAHHDEVLRPLQKTSCPEFDFDSEDATLKAFALKLAEKGEDAVNEFRSAVEKHDGSLARSLGVVPLERIPKWEVHAEGGCIRLPRSSKDSILICGGDELPDVVAPYLLLRVARGAGEDDAIHLESELRRCCLLRACEDDRLLRGLLAIWSGAFGETPPNDSEVEILIDPKGRVTCDNNLCLPKVIDCVDGRIRYVLTTQYDTIRVALPAGHVVAVKEGMLGSDKQLDVDWATRWKGLDPAAAAAWTQFVTGQVRRQVTVQFLFLKSGISPLAATSIRKRCRES